MPADRTPERPRTGGNCCGCGSYHGGINERFLCLEKWLAKTRQELAAARAALGMPALDTSHE
jgi:hypothetical protein